MDIKELVEKTIKEIDSNDPFRIAKAKRILIIYESMPDQVFGFFNMKYRTKMIHLNQNLHEDLHLFVCAHELGHALQHHDIAVPCLRDTFFSTDKIERQANKFAVELLLPDNYLREYADFGMYEIARNFGVPEKAVELKLI